ncbi:MAG TPA: filamentous hemagglutinin N-terminal domain-containing protein, partial [Gammaproteobacteria bacterium]|nr:filamentous hemagglutinin N-terminal domain-containing protein [Gammaproteobacteria bacterium]
MKHRTPTLRPLNALLKQALHSRALRRAALGLGAFAPALALANPTGGQVVAGNASISVPDSDHTVVNQASQSAILNWQQFSIGSNQYVQFIQPDSSAVVLNRVIGGNPSQILGNMSANGQVFLVNPNGVFFGQGASLDVQGLIATTFDIKNSDFLAGHYVFAKGDGAPDAGVTNQGTLTANNGYIVLAGDYANNDGVIAAQAGQVVLASGNQMTLTLADNSLVSFVVDQATMSQYAGVSNTGSIEADGGVVLMTAKVANALTATAVNNSGLITAHSIQDHNGTIILAAQGGDIDVSGTLDASATQAGVTGGSVVIRGNGHTEIASTANILAEGDAAKGGFIELSGHTLKVRGQVNTGRSGELLIDPSILTIGAGTNFSSGTGGTPSTVTVGVGYIQNQLNSNKSVVLVASNSIGHSAGVTSLTATGNGNLSLKIGSVTAGSGSLKDPSSLGFGYGNGCQYAGVCSPGTSYKFSPNSNGTINLSGVTINIKGTFTASASFGTIKLGNVTAKAITLGGGGPSGYVYDISTQNLTATNGAVVIYGGNQADDHVTINGSVSAESSSGSVSGKSISITSGYIDVTGNLAATGTGSAIRIRGYGSSDNGGWIHIGGNVIATNGSVSITENGGASITVNGSIQALGKVSMSVNGNRNAPALIDVGGNINAGGAVNIVAHNSASATAGASINVASVTGKSITLTATASGSANITASTLHANGAATSDGVSVKASTSQASHNGGKINVNGGITVDHGGVTLNAKGGEDSGGKISVSGNISAAGNVSVT